MKKPAALPNIEVASDQATAQRATAGLTPPATPAVVSAHENLAQALAAAQGEIRNPGKENVAQIKSDKGSYQYRYTTLADGLNAIKGPLAKHGIAVVQSTRMQDELLILVTRLVHESGDSVDGEWPVANWTRLTPQQMGSALTYARRYSLFSLVGISGADEDDDGASATAAAAANADPVIGGDEVAHLYSLLAETDTDHDLFLKAMGGASDIAALRMSQYKRAVGIFTRKLQTQAAMAKQNQQPVSENNGSEDK